MRYLIKQKIAIINGEIQDSDLDMDLDEESAGIDESEEELEEFNNEEQFQFKFSALTNEFNAESNGFLFLF